MTCPECQAPNDDAAEVCFTCGKSLVVAPTAITRGALIAERYEVLSPLGRGGMGMVYKAHDRILDETVAVKVLRAEVAREAEGARRFRTEIKLARKIRHRNVCAIHEYGESGGLRFIAMELVEGVDLRRQIQERGVLPEREAFEVAIQAANGLQAIHKAGIIHRDLKTANIMRDASGRVRVMDFGIAKRFGTESTLGGRVVGTPEYMSPEQARGHKLDFRSDIYALGIVIYEMFAGRVPFQGETPIATILMHLNEPPPLDPGGATRFPAPLVPVLRQALAKAPDDRFRTARELGEALESARGAAAPSGVRGQPRNQARPRAVQAPLASRVAGADPRLLAAAGVALALALAWIVNRPAESVSPAVVPTATPMAPPPTTSATPDPASRLASPVRGSEPAAAPTPFRSPAARASKQPEPPRPAPSAAARAAAGAPPAAASLPVAPSPVATASATAAPPAAPAVMASAPTPARPAPQPSTLPGSIVWPGPGVTPPELVKAADPVYPVLAKRLKRQARVTIRALVDEHGKVVSAQVVEGDPSRLGFDEAALEAAYKMLYKPARKDGVPVKMWLELPVTFKP